MLELKRRYTNMYVPSDFFTTRVRWVDAFPANRPLTMSRPCAFHVMHKEVEEVSENGAILEPADADYSFSAKVCFMVPCHLTKSTFYYISIKKNKLY